MKDKKIAIIGAGLAGCEAAWQLAKRGAAVDLYEMRPVVKTEAHRTGDVAELVCSNSLKSEDVSNAHGLLKAELQAAGSLLVSCAKKSRIPAGGALAVDRDLFSKKVREKLDELDNLTIISKEVTSLEEVTQAYDRTILATGPLTSEALATELVKYAGEDQLYFYDAIAPVIYTDSIDMNEAYLASRYGKGTDDYINCPMNQAEYETFIQDLLEAEKVPFKNFEKAKHFEGCLPIEVMASRGTETLSYGPMKPVGLEHPKTGERPHAVLQLRRENTDGTMYNLVGCQTRMMWPEQKRVFGKIRGLQQCEFARYGSMHRNTYVNAPTQLSPSLAFNKIPGVYLAGQITGVEGYMESTAMGMWAAMNVVCDLEEKDAPIVDHTTMMGGLVTYLKTATSQNFQPMNSNYGLIRPMIFPRKTPKKDKRVKMAEAALNRWEDILKEMGW